jgi:hypothetical protein
MSSLVLSAVPSDDPLVVAVEEYVWAKGRIGIEMCADIY